MTGTDAQFSPQDHLRMARALYLAAQPLNSCDPNPRVGCAIEKNGEIVAEAWHQRAGEAHAEILALAQAGQQARAATVYLTLEPCCHTGRTGPCTDALIAAGVARVVVAMTDPNPRVGGGGLAALANAGIDVSLGVLSDQAEQLNRGFISRMRRGRPFVCSKIAASLDGRTALASGQSQWITSEASRADVQQLRARSSAILTGSGTVEADNPRMTVRIEPDACWQPPLRVILDSTLRTSPQANICSNDATTLILTSTDADKQRTVVLREAGVQVETVANTGTGLDLHAVLEHLAALEINELMVEAGPILNGALLQTGLLDEIILYQAPHLLGPDARPMFDLPSLTNMSERRSLKLISTRRIGNDLRMRLAVVGAASSRD